VAGAELGEGGTVLPGKDGFFLGDVGGLKVEDRVEWPGSEGCIHILSVQLLPGFLSVLDCSVAEETLNKRTKLKLERFLLILFFLSSYCFLLFSSGIHIIYKMPG